LKSEKYLLTSPTPFYINGSLSPVLTNPPLDRRWKWNPFFRAFFFLELGFFSLYSPPPDARSPTRRSPLSRRLSLRFYPPPTPNQVSSRDQILPYDRQNARAFPFFLNGFFFAVFPLLFSIMRFPSACHDDSSPSRQFYFSLRFLPPCLVLGLTCFLRPPRLSGFPLVGADDPLFSEPILHWRRNFSATAFSWRSSFHALLVIPHAELFFFSSPCAISPPFPFELVGS